MRKDSSKPSAPKAAENAEPEDAAVPDEVDAAGAAEGEVQLTRAERRAKGKGGQPKPYGSQHFVPKGSNAQAQRNWSTSRSG
jgi:hypothetical protein